MLVEARPHPAIEAYLAADPRRNVFPLHVCRERPRDRSPAAIADGRICGALVRGSEFGIQPVQCAWLVAEEESAVRALLVHARQTGRLDGLQLPWR